MRLLLVLVFRVVVLVVVFGLCSCYTCYLLFDLLFGVGMLDCYSLVWWC